MVPLLVCSLIGWAVILERMWQYRKMGRELRVFHYEALNALLRSESEKTKSLIQAHIELPTAQLLQTALERLSHADPRLKDGWKEAIERRRQLVNLDIKKNLWILGTIGSSAPFIGLAGTVIGVLQSFGEMSKKGVGGFTVVAGGISEALIATAAGIVVAVIAVVAYNAFQTFCSKLILTVKIQSEEMAEVLAESRHGV